MQMIVAVWLAGGAVCSLVYLVGIWPTFREHTRTTDVAFEVFHFGTRGSDGLRGLAGGRGGVFSGRRQPEQPPAAVQGKAKRPNPRCTGPGHVICFPLLAGHCCRTLASRPDR